MIRWILDNLLSIKHNAAKANSQVVPPTFMLEQSIAYSAFISGRGEQISFGEFLQRRTLAQ